MDAYVDNKNLLDFWNNEGGKGIPLTNEIKSVFQFTLDLKVFLKLFHIPSEDNDSDSPSRHTSDLDCTLSKSSWNLIESSFGPHTFDLMAISSHIRKAKDGQELRFFSPFRCKDSSGANVFSQKMSRQELLCSFTICLDWPSD